jgi:methionine--tRNA ligase beta chain
MFDLNGKTALVTGSGQGIGRAIALLMASRGAKVIVNWRSRDEIAMETINKLQESGAEFLTWKYDLSSPTIKEDFEAWAKENGVTVDILVLNASVQFRNAWENITFDDFLKLDIRVGTVLECERVPKMKKLLKFLIDDGLEKRTIVSGIAQWYEPEQLIGKQVCFIANLPPREFKNGLVSEGMILSAEDWDGTISVTTVERNVKPGSQVK